MKHRTIASMCALLSSALLTAGLEPATATTPAPPHRSCTGNLRARADIDSLARRDDGPPYSTGQINAFVPAAEAAFKAAADDLCVSGAIDAGKVARYRHLLVRSGSGADDSAVYDDPDAAGHDTLVFEWVFSEEGLTLPDKADIEAALKCWNHPDEPVCSEREP